MSENGPVRYTAECGPCDRELNAVMPHKPRPNGVWIRCRRCEEPRWTPGETREPVCGSGKYVEWTELE